MDTLECIRTRRSVRKYKPDPVPDDVIEKIMEAVQWAPSWVNMQPWEAVIVKDEARRKALQETLPKGNPAKDAFAQAPVVIAMCATMGKSGFKKGDSMTVWGDWTMFDMGIACQNLCLAAHALGLGTVHVGYFDHGKADQVLGLPEGVRSFELIPLGTPDEEAKAPKRRQFGEFVHHEKF